MDTVILLAIKVNFANKQYPQVFKSVERADHFKTLKFHSMRGFIVNTVKPLSRTHI